MSNHAASLLGELPAEAARRWPNATAVTYEGSSLTFGELNEAIDRAARALIARGIQRGDCVGIWITNRPEFVVVFYAVVKVGAIAVPFNTRYRQDDVAFVLRRAECKLLITVDSAGPVNYLEMLSAVLPGLDGKRLDGACDYPNLKQFPQLRQIVIVSRERTDGPLSWTNFLSESDQISDDKANEVWSQVRADDIALIVFTSGTTGDPKGVMHDHSSLRAVRERASLWPLGVGDTVLNFLPMFHLYSLSEMVIACMAMGARQVVMEAFEPDQAIRVMVKKPGFGQAVQGAFLKTEFAWPTS